METSAYTVLLVWLGGAFSQRAWQVENRSDARLHMLFAALLPDHYGPVRMRRVGSTQRRLLRLKRARAVDAARAVLLNSLQ